MHVEKNFGHFLVQQFHIQFSGTGGFFQFLHSTTEIRIERILLLQFLVVMASTLMSGRGRMRTTASDRSAARDRRHVRLLRWTEMRIDVTHFTMRARLATSRLLRRAHT